MSREFKFRLWSKSEKCFVNPNILEVWDESGKMTPFQFIKTGKLDPIYMPIENYVIQQHTGLNDKNNNPIYEGDIVRFNPDNPGIATVEFKDYAWVLSESKKAFLPFCYLIKEEVEIIGNLFELPCSKPGAFDSNGECWTCDGWATDCPFINARELNPTK